jgi:hypothetical protein
MGSTTRRGGVGAVRISGRGTGLHALPPGRYIIESTLGRVLQEVRLDSAVTVRLEERRIGLAVPGQ